MLIDTDVLIWNFRGHQRAAKRLDDAVGFYISAVTYMELVQGMRNNAELNALRQSLRHWQATVLPVEPQVSARAIFLIESYALSHGLRVADALIAASAMTMGLPLLTANTKHYRMIEGLTLTTFKP
jgi:predicted nucleic acid-binding protein